MAFFSFFAHSSATLSLFQSDFIIRLFSILCVLCAQIFEHSEMLVFFFCIRSFLCTRFTEKKCVCFCTILLILFRITVARIFSEEEQLFTVLSHKEFNFIFQSIAFQHFSQFPCYAFPFCIYMYENRIVYRIFSSLSSALRTHNKMHNLPIHKSQTRMHSN